MERIIVILSDEMWVEVVKIVAHSEKRTLKNIDKLKEKFKDGDFSNLEYRALLAGRIKDLILKQIPKEAFDKEFKQ